MYRLKSIITWQGHSHITHITNVSYTYTHYTQTGYRYSRFCYATYVARNRITYLTAKLVVQFAELHVSTVPNFCAANWTNELIESVCGVVKGGFYERLDVPAEPTATGKMQDNENVPTRSLCICAHLRLAIFVLIFTSPRPPWFNGLDD